MTKRSLALAFVALGSLAAIACGDVITPALSSPAPVAAAQVATTITLTMIRGIGSTADRAYLSGHILDASGKPMVGGGLVVTLTTTAGAITPATITANSNGDFTAEIAVQLSATVTAVVGAATGSVVVPATAALNTPLTVSLATVTAVVNTPIALQATANTNGIAIVTYLFTFGDGTPGSATSLPTVLHTYGAKGSYAASVMVTDAAGRTVSGGAIITVN